MTNKERYKVLCEEESSIPLFSQYWWMEAVCIGKSWDVIFEYQNSKIIAALPYLIGSKFGIRYVIQPQLTQTNGLWVKSDVLDKEHIINSIISKIKLLKVKYFNQNFHYSFNDLNPFVKAGYKLKKRFTYIIPDISNLESVFKGFDSSKKRQIRKAEKSLSVDYSIAPTSFFEFISKSFEQKGDSIYYSKDLFLSLYQSALERGQGKIIAIKDDKGVIHSAAFVVWTKISAYYLVYGIDKEYNSSGASTLMVWESIKWLSDKTQTFDFEGSMVEGIANSYKRFGTYKQQYYSVCKITIL